MKQIHRIFTTLHTALCLAAVILLAGCATIPSHSGTAGMQEYSLANGIPVYVQKSTDNQLVSLYIVVKGGTAMLPPEKSGLEMALVRMMKSGSSQYNYDAIQSLEYRTHADFFGFSQNEGSGLGIECIDYYLDDMLPVLTDGFLHPAYGKKEYDMMMKEYSQRIQSIQHDPASLGFYTLVHTVYKNHPYETSAQPVPESLRNITVGNMKTLHEKMMDAKRISVVAVGNIDGRQLVRKLNGTIGRIPALETDFTGPSIPPVTVGGDPVVRTLSAATGTGFMYRCFASPAVTDDDYIPACIAADMYGDVLFQIVREKYGACYTPSSEVLSSKAAVGLVELYRVSDLAHAVSYVREARELMEQGKLVTGKDASGNYEYATIADRLESYKNSYINRKYVQQQTNSGVAAKLAASILQFDNAYTADTMAAKARQVTAADIERVFDTYWVKQPSQWFAVVGPGDETKVQF